MSKNRDAIQNAVEPSTPTHIPTPEYTPPPTPVPGPCPRAPKGKIALYMDLRDWPIEDSTGLSGGNLNHYKGNKKAREVYFAIKLLNKWKKDIMGQIEEDFGHHSNWEQYKKAVEEDLKKYNDLFKRIESGKASIEEIDEAYKNCYPLAQLPQTVFGREKAICLGASQVRFDVKESPITETD